MISTAFRAAIIETLERAILQGSGSGQPTGITNTTGVLTLARVCDDGVSMSDLVALKYKIAPRYRDNAIFMLQDNSAEKLESSIAISSSATDIFTPTTALGIPWKPTTQSPALGSNGDTIIGDWSKYVLAMEQDIVVKRGNNNDNFRRNATSLSVYMIVGGEAVVPRAFAYLTITDPDTSVATCGPHQSLTFLQAISEGLVPGHFALNKFGHNSLVAANNETVWDVSNDYPWQSAAELIQTASTDVDDQGLLRSSGVATGGTKTTLIDTTADFIITDSVAVGDLLINDTNSEHAIITAITATTITPITIHNHNNGRTTELKILLLVLRKCLRSRFIMAEIARSIVSPIGLTIKTHHST